MENSERLAKVEERTQGLDDRTKLHGEMLQRVDETMTQLRIYTQSSQRLLESHEKGMQDSNRRELSQIKHVEERFDNVMEKMHNLELNSNNRIADERKIFQDEFKSQCSKMYSTVEKAKELSVTANNKQNIRIDTLEKFHWKVIGVLTILTPILTIAATQLLKFLLK